MKQFFLFALALLLSAQPVWAYPVDLVDKVLEKKIIGKLLPGNRPVLIPSQLEMEPFVMPWTTFLRKVSTQQFSQHKPHTQIKHYRILENPETFQSLISVTDAATGQEIRRISVGRRAQRLVGNPSTNRLYVLCGGYFSSIWEVDTVQDVVVRKLGTTFRGKGLSPLWHPKDMALLPRGHTLAVASGELRLIDLHTGEVKSILALPSEAVEVEHIYPLSLYKLALISRGVQGQPVFHTLDLNSQTFTSVKHLSAPTVNPIHSVIQAPQAYYKLPSVARSGFVASRNNDFIHMVDLQTLKPVALIPVDFAVDDLLLTTDRRRLFAYHRRFGQISVIELNPHSPQRFSVIRRIRDARFRSEPTAPLYLAQAVDQVYLWDGYSQIKASIDQQTLYLKMNVPFAVNLSGSQVWNSPPTHKRFYLKDGELTMEYAAGAPSILPARIETGGHLVALVMSPDRRRLYMLQSANAQPHAADSQPESGQLLVMDAFSHKILARLKVGKNPRSLSISYRGDRLYVLNADEGILQAIDTRSLKPAQVLALDIGLFQPQILWVFDKKMAHMVQIELPRHFTDVARMVG